MESQRARLHGLPNLPVLGSLFQPEFTYVVPANLTFVLAARADITRWFIAFDDTNGFGMLVTTDPDDPPTHGFIVPPGSYREFDYKLYGALVAQDWYLWCRGSLNPSQVFCQTIKPK